MEGRAVGRVRKIWDLPTRLSHWLLAMLFAGAWWTADNGAMLWHRYIGYAMAGLLVFRVLWGFVGSTTARFRHFVRGPRAVLAYLRELLRRERTTAPAGHNPLGALSTLALLSLLVGQVGLGLFAVDVDGVEAGPLSFYLSFDAGRDAAIWHERIFDLLLVLVGLHIAAVLFYWLGRGQNLIGRMIHGRGIQQPDAGTLHFAPRWRLIAVLIVSCLLAGYLKSLDVPL